MMRTDRVSESDRVSDPDQPTARGRTKRGWIAVAAVAGLLAVPVAIAAGDGGYAFVMMWGLLDPGWTGLGDGVHVYPIWAYLSNHPIGFEALPASIRAWPVGFGFHVLALASATSGATIGREDRRVTGGLLVLAGLASVSVAFGITTRYGGIGTSPTTFVPLGAIVTWVVAFAIYGTDLRDLLGK
ncbi:TIGR04206 family protein [Halopenitus sp. H-Gu1]|uniref:TIGR04206 family protein n=1 Tax=Halopenitus sp. H-Gu1 TaxID=3242697 RepID=UPI00359EF944